MPRMGDLAAQDSYAAPEDQPWYQPFSNVAQGLARDIPRAVNWFGEQARKSPEAAQADVRNVMGGLAEQAYTLPERTLGASEQMRTEGTYNPAPAVETALMTMGTGAIAGAPVRAGETALGAGPIRAYHSSPHDFDKFDLSKIGSGEGAQMYGHGLYFAENPAVSGQGGQYWNSFQRRFSGPEYQASERLRSAGFDRDKAIENVNDRINRAINSGDTNKQFMDEQIKTLQLLESGKPFGPRTYEVNINADPAHMLDWDKPLSQQAAGDTVARMLEKRMITPHENMKGVNAYGELGTHYDQLFKRPQNLNADQAVSVALQRAGIPGIRYLDQGSRAGIPPMQAMLKTVELQDALAVAKSPTQRAAIEAELAALEQSMKPTSNYVIFDPSKIDIMKKYGIAGAAATGGMGALAAQDTYRGE
jgi:hypothetical protein